MTEGRKPGARVDVTASPEAADPARVAAAEVVNQERHSIEAPTKVSDLTLKLMDEEIKRLSTDQEEGTAYRLERVTTTRRVLSDMMNEKPVYQEHRKVAYEVVGELATYYMQMAIEAQIGHDDLTTSAKAKIVLANHLLYVEGQLGGSQDLD